MARHSHVSSGPSPPLRRLRYGHTQRHLLTEVFVSPPRLPDTWCGTMAEVPEPGGVLGLPAHPPVAHPSLLAFCQVTAVSVTLTDVLICTLDIERTRIPQQSTADLAAA